MLKQDFEHALKSPERSLLVLAVAQVTSMGAEPSAQTRQEQMYDCNWRMARILKQDAKGMFILYQAFPNAEPIELSGV